MEDIDSVLVMLKVPTDEIIQEIIQEVLIATKKHGTVLVESTSLWNEVANILFQHLGKGLIKFDDQLLCATCFYTVLALVDNNEHYVNTILELVEEELNLRETSAIESTKTTLTISLIYGVYQSSFLTQADNDLNNLVPILQVSFKLLCGMAYEYSKYTFIVFKCLSLLKKVLNTNLCEHLFSKENQNELLNVVNNNWENPISGVRDLNTVIFQTLISTMKKTTLSRLLEQINGFYWNKAKYLMLTEVVSHPSFIDTDNTMLKSHWVDGLMYSLSKPGLVSAGADLYFAIFNKLKSKEEWSEIFMEAVLELLKGKLKKAVENFSNYWCLTTFKSYPALSILLLEEVVAMFPDFTKQRLYTSLMLKNSEEKLYSCLCIIKPANKLALTQNWYRKVSETMERLVFDALVHCNIQLRMMAFEIVCLSQNKAMPTKNKYDLILDYLRDNINSDSTVLRISMINNFTYFLTQLHVSYHNYLKTEPIEDQENLKRFFLRLQNHIIESLEIEGNYQRKITCIKLTNIILKNVNEVPRKKRMQTKVCNKSIIQMLKDEDQWLLYNESVMKSFTKFLKDPAEDVRENVGKMLLEHYFEDLRKTIVLNGLIEDALKCMMSKFFYDISCGQSMFILIISLLCRKDQPEAFFKNVNDVYDFAHRKLIFEYGRKRDVVDSINQGKQLHSFMSILQAVLEVCRNNNYKINISNESVIKLLDVLQGISNQFAWEEESATSSDFSKMSDMVQDIVMKSGHDLDRGDDIARITGIEKIVLMCLWLNVKASCELSSLLIRYQKQDSEVVICEKALGIISHVLETCRHKGAIEAAGASLGLAIRHLTSLPENTEVSKLPLSFLKNKLRELIKEANRMASVTRRGAGLSIMVHRIVSSDMKRGKPLFHYFMKTILETCNNTEDISSLPTKADNIDDEKDLPKAIYIHFLTRIVTDSSLASDVMFYSAELAELAFGNLTNSHWQIRNAALQLYGALIQKLIGQKKISGADEESKATVACDELRTHSPKLWSYVVGKIQDETWKDEIQRHSNLVPILNLLASLSPRYNFSNMFSQDYTYDNLLPHLLSLLGSPIYTVRRLTAESIYNIYPPEVLGHFKKIMFESENSLHGSLLLVAKYFKLRNLRHDYDELWKKYVNMFTTKKYSYLCRSIYDNIFCNDYPSIEKVKGILKELQCDSYAPGIFLWANMCIRKYIDNAPWVMIPQILKIILSCNDYETYCKDLLKKIENTFDIDGVVILEIVNTLLTFKNKFDSGMVWRILYQILYMHTSSVWLEDQSFDLRDIYTYLEDHKVSYKLRYILPFAARMITCSSELKHLVNISKTVESLTDPDFADVDMRYIAAVTNNEIAAKIVQNCDAGVTAALVSSVKSAVILLQDEDEEVRMLSTGYYCIVENHFQLLQPNICLNNLMNYEFLLTLFDKDNIKAFIKELEEFLAKNSGCKNDDEYNPFANDSSNIYLETNVFRRLVESLKHE